jgi:hypothetical protein
MTADAAQAETYLRLMVETELRHALGYPKYQGFQPDQRAPGRAVLAALGRPAGQLARLGRQARTMIPGQAQPARAMRSSAGRVAMRTMITMDRRVSAIAAATLPASDALRPRLARLAWQLRWRARRATRILRAAHGQAAPPALAAVHRVRQVANALVAAGALSDTAAESALQALMHGLLARAKIGEEWLDGRGGPWRPAPASAHPAGSVRAAPVGAPVWLGPDGTPGRGWLLTLVLAPDRASLTAAGWLTGADTAPGPGPPRPPFVELNQLSAVDDRGSSYQLRASSGSWGLARWSRSLEVSPLPPPGIRWLDITVPDHPAPVRVDLAFTGPSPAQADLAELPAELEPPGGRCCAADRILDACSVNLLSHLTAASPPAPGPPSGLADVASALQAVGALQPGCAALGRLITLSGQLGLSFPAALRATARPARLPAAWTSVLAGRATADGQYRAAPVAAVLPPVDGARFALAGLQSTADSATLHALAWDWYPDDGEILGGTQYWWWAHDDAGRWHVAALGSHGCGNGQAHLELRFQPPIHPRATALDIFVLGPASAAAVTVPLDWASR